MSGLTRYLSQAARPQRFHIVLISAVAIALTGCAAFHGSDATTEPTAAATPGSSQLQTSTPEPTASPDQTPPGSIDHPTGATDVVLRMEWGGGFVPMQTFVTQMPQFTLYGDGTAVFRPLPDPTGADFRTPSAPFLTGHLSEDAVQALLAFALHDGGLAIAKTSYDYPGIADASSTIFTVDAGGVDKTVSAYALFESTNDGPDQADREALNSLQMRLNAFETEARNGAVANVSDYDPAAYKVVMFDASTGTPPNGVEPIDWPWKDVQPADFVKSDTASGASLSMSREQVSKLTTVPEWWPALDLGQIA